MKEYIRKKQLERREWLLFNAIPIHIIHSFPSHINVQNIIDKIEDKIPNHLFSFSNIENIYVGKFKELKIKNVQALFLDGSIYVSNHDQNTNINEIQISKDIIHEMGHSLENQMGHSLFSADLENEFLSKRKKLEIILQTEGYDTDSYNFYDTEYDVRFDHFLMNVVGYDKLSILIISLFDSPYSATSISEYFANGFENYFFKDISYLKSTCPILYNKIESLPNYLGELS